MKKRILLGIVLLIFLSLAVLGYIFLFSNDKKEEGNKEEEKTETKVDDLTIKLDLTKTLKGITFNYPSEGKVLSGNDYFIVDFKINNKIAFRTGVYYYDGKTIEEVMNETKANIKENITINNIEWNIYEVISESSGRKLIYYNYQKENELYSVLFSFDDNGSDFINKFMNLINFN